jgi:hypothetical protein
VRLIWSVLYPFLLFSFAFERGSVLYGTEWIGHEAPSFSVKMNKDFYAMIYYFTLDVCIHFPVKYKYKVMYLVLKAAP